MVRPIYNFAWQHLKAATIFRDQLIELERANAGKEWGSFIEEIRSYGSACILSSTAALEALINELFIAPNRLHHSLTDFETEFWGTKGIERKPILKKYQIALDKLVQPRLDEGTSPFWEASAVIDLRNALVHFKPMWDPVRKRPVDFETNLKGKFELSPFYNSDADFVAARCISASCATWVIKSVFAFINEFDVRTRLDDGKLSGFKKLEIEFLRS